MVVHRKHRLVTGPLCSRGHQVTRPGDDSTVLSFSRNNADSPGVNHRVNTVPSLLIVLCSKTFKYTTCEGDITQKKIARRPLRHIEFTVQRGHPWRALDGSSSNGIDRDTQLAL